MADIVSSQELAEGSAGGRVFSGSLLNFFSVPGGKEAKQACRKKGAILHVASYEVDDGDLIELARAGGALAFSFSDILPEPGFRRAILISKMRLLLSACRRRGTGFVVCSLAKNANELRGARELSAFAAVLGMADVERKGAEKRLELLCGAAKVDK
ncbi:MAG: hypothetical protein WC717_05005 [Candidatus Micrarchaeia archaeon]|jgi:RNase P/RNase MRP subunit p30